MYLPLVDVNLCTCLLPTRPFQVRPGMGLCGGHIGGGRGGLFGQRPSPLMGPPPPPYPPPAAFRPHQMGAPPAGGQPAAYPTAKPGFPPKQGHRPLAGASYPPVPPPYAPRQPGATAAAHASYSGAGVTEAQLHLQQQQHAAMMAYTAKQQQANAGTGWF